MNEEKKVPFKWEYGEETISLQLGMYANNQRLYIGMITHTEDGAEPFADMTVNLPGYSLDPGEAFISGDISKDLLRFIKENKLGKAVIHSINSTEAPQSVQEAMAQIAVKKTLAETEQLHRGTERLQLVDIVYRQRKHSIPGAAMALFVSEGTARDWNRQFIYRVAEYMGFL